MERTAASRGLLGHAREMAFEHALHRLPHDVARDRVGALLLTFVDQLDLAADCRNECVQIHDPRHDRLPAVQQSASFHVGD